jgi:ABC-type multidrug transport system ATPase subunit
MTRHEIKRKFDEIVDFSGCEAYIDTPVKRYSSGMYVRLAFAVAAHLESEILIVDEVLAVGDAEFQKKCLGKMNDVAKGEGRTVLFVSHNMAAVRELCNKGIILENGTVKFPMNSINEVVHQYKIENHSIDANFKMVSSKNDEINIVNAYLNNVNFTNDDEIKLVVELECKNITPTISRIVIDLIDVETQLCINSEGVSLHDLKSGKNQFEYKIPSNFLNARKYSIEARIDIPFERIIIEKTILVNFEINEILSSSLGRLGANEPSGLIHYRFKK